MDYNYFCQFYPKKIGRDIKLNKVLSLVCGILLIILLILLCITVTIFIIKNMKPHFSYRNFKNQDNTLDISWYELAFKDNLTGLFNRNAYDLKIKELEKQNNGDIYILLFDIDSFKTINDTKGHLAGDEVLISAAKRLSKIFNSQNHSIYRFGGDEFIVISENIQEDDLISLLLQLKELEISQNDFRFSKGYSAVACREKNAFKKAFYNADEMLFCDKNSKKIKKC